MSGASSSRSLSPSSSSVSSSTSSMNQQHHHSHYYHDMKWRHFPLILLLLWLIVMIMMMMIDIHDPHHHYNNHYFTTTTTGTWFDASIMSTNSYPRVSFLRQRRSRRATASSKSTRFQNKKIIDLSCHHVRVFFLLLVTGSCVTRFALVKMH
jgi:hypothetical protein